MVIVIAAIVATVAVHFIDVDEDGMDAKQVLKIATESLGVGIGLVILKHVALRHPEFSWLCLIILVAFIIGLMYQWHKQGSDPGEFVCFTLLTLIAGGIACVAAANYASATIIPLLAVILLSIFAIGFYGFMAFKFYREVNMLDDDEREALLKEEKNDTVKEMDRKVGRFNRLMAAVAVATLIALAGTTGVVLGMADSGLFEGAPDGADNTMAAEANAADGSEEVPEEAEEFLVEWTKKESNRIDSEFAEKLKAEAGDGEITADIVKKVILQDCKKDPSVLAIWGYKFGLYDDPDNYKPLMTKDGDKEKLSEEGILLYNKVSGYLEAVAAEREEAPEDGVNSGYNNGFVVAENSGISGDRTGTKMSCPNGDVFWVMDRCANIVYKKAPNNVPTGPTDNPTPTPSYSKNPSEDPVNKGNAQKGGGQNKSSDGAGEVQPVDPRTQKPTGSGNDNNHGYSDPKTVTPSNPPVVEEHKSEPVVTDSNPMNYQPAPVTNRGPVDTSAKPTNPGGDGEFTPSD